MVGGGYRRDEGSSTVSNSNVFAALESLRKKKKSDQEKGKVNKSAVKGAGGKSKRGEEEKQVYWAPAPLTVKSWADVDDDEDDDYYATTAPPMAMWAGGSKGEGSRKPDPVEESESEYELLDEGDEGDEDVEEEHDHEPEVEEEHEPTVKKPVEASPAPKETERQLSKKERRKKELAELEAILADFGVNPKENSEDATKDTKEGESNGDAEKKDNANPVESKSAKKKKKDKVSKDMKEPKDEPNSSSGVSNGQEEIEHVEQDSSAVDVKQRLKKLASAKKKKSSKEMDGAARAAAMEAAARNSRIAAAKKKEKSHYNQQPTR